MFVPENYEAIIAKGVGKNVAYEVIIVSNAKKSSRLIFIIKFEQIYLRDGFTDQL